MKSVFLLFILLLPFGASAQKEANIWYFGHGAGLNFNHDPPQVLVDGALGAHEGSAAMADGDGNFLFSTNGSMVWNSKQDIMENGEELGGNSSARQSTVIVPKPGAKNLYYILTMDSQENGYQNGLMYSVVDLNANKGLGKVIQKGIQLHGNGTESLAVVGSCQDGGEQEYWAVAAQRDNPDKVYAYKIDAEGINPEAVVSSFPGSKNLNYIKFSPAGNKAAIIDQVHLSGDDLRVVVADFDFGAGVFHNLNYIPVESTAWFNQTEFSPNGKILYVSSGSQIQQIDLSNDYHISDVLETGSGFMGEFQLAPDGNMYIAALSYGLTNKISMISNPNEIGLEGKLYENIIDLREGRVSLGFPNLVSTFLYNGLQPDAGRDSLLCSGQALQLGTAPESDVFYDWYPSDHLNQADIADPHFQFHNTADTIQEFEYILTAYNEHCAKKDTVVIQVYPAPPERISGSRSVCPGVVEVAYSVPQKEGYQYHWEVEGGTIAAGQGTATILVNWGPTNPDAMVRLISTSEADCESPTIELPVRINVELDTETPQGPEEVCANQREGIPYAVINTNGSVYTWDVTGGSITAGQGTHQVWVDWESTGTHKIWLQERSVTIDTVCYGVSDSLEVVVFKDTTEIALDYVSISLEDDEHIEIGGNHALGAAASAGFVLYRREWGAEDWERAGEAGKDSIYFNDGPLDTDRVSYEYRLSSRNPCDEEIHSIPHRTILLRGEAKEERDEVFLQWNAYEGWSQGVEKYEVWRRVDEAEEYKLMGTAGPNSLQFTASNGTDGFKHYFRIRAVENNTGHTSWSNEISLRFRHELTIPNVFTPNGDDFNESFKIAKLDLYPDNELTVYNRWGKEIYSKKGYRGEWNGSESPAGVYYYSLRLNSTGRHFRGWVQLIRKGAGRGEE